MKTIILFTISLLLLASSTAFSQEKKKFSSEAILMGSGGFIDIGLGFASINYLEYTPTMSSRNWYSTCDLNFNFGLKIYPGTINKNRFGLQINFLKAGAHLFNAAQYATQFSYSYSFNGFYAGSGVGCTFIHQLNDNHAIEVELSTTPTFFFILTSSGPSCIINAAVKYKIKKLSLGINFGCDIIAYRSDATYIIYANLMVGYKFCTWD